MVSMLKTKCQMYSKNRFPGIDRLNRNRTMHIANYYYTFSPTSVMGYTILLFRLFKIWDNFVNIVDFGKCNLGLKSNLHLKGFSQTFLQF